MVVSLKKFSGDVHTFYKNPILINSNFVFK